MAAGPIPPAPGRIVPSAERTMGVPISPSVNEDRDREKMWLQVLYPRRRDASFHRRKGRWGCRSRHQLTRIEIEKNSRCRSYTPRHELTRIGTEKIWPQVLYPPGRRIVPSVHKDHGGRRQWRKSAQAPYGDGTITSGGASK